MHFLWVFCGALAVPHAAASESTAGDYAYGAGANVTRGLWNVISSPAEIPCAIREDVKQQGGAGAFMGFAKGLAFMVRRIVVGVSEIGTFVLPAEATLPGVCQSRQGQAAVS